MKWLEVVKHAYQCPECPETQDLLSQEKDFKDFLLDNGIVIFEIFLSVVFLKITTRGLF